MKKKNPLLSFSSAFYWEKRRRRRDIPKIPSRIPSNFSISTSVFPFLHCSGNRLSYRPPRKNFCFFFPSYFRGQKILFMLRRKRKKFSCQLCIKRQQQTPPREREKTFGRSFLFMYRRVLFSPLQFRFRFLDIVHMWKKGVCWKDFALCLTKSRQEQNKQDFLKTAFPMRKR